MRRRARVAALCVFGACLVAATGCGKKGDPLPPLRPVPARVGALSALRNAARLEVSLTVPPSNTDGSTPGAVAHVDLYGAVVPPGGAVPPVSQIVGDARNLRTRVEVRPPVSDGPSTGAPEMPADPRPQPGDRAVWVATAVSETDAPAGSTLYLAAVAVTAGARGRSGPVSELLAVPLGPLPQPPAGLDVSHDETTITVSWAAGASPDAVQVFRGTPGVPMTEAELLTPVPTRATSITAPLVAFGRESCFATRAVQTIGPVTLEGEPSPARCIRPVDRFPPPSPAGLQALQEGTAVTLIWSAVSASDLAGYIVLRGENLGETLGPLMRVPIMETTYRDSTVQPGVSYSYAVYAVDNAPVPNVSQLSNRQRVTIR